VHQIRFPLGMLGSLHCSPDPLAVFKGPVSKGMKGKGEKIGREGGNIRTEGGARESVKHMARKVASTLLMLRLQRGLVTKLMP